MKFQRKLPDIKVIVTEKIKLNPEGYKFLVDARDFVRDIRKLSSDRGVLFHSGNAADYLDSLITLLEAKGAFNEED